MNRKKVVYIIPGFKHSSKNKPYKAIAKILKRQGYRPIFMNIPWKQTTISENTKYFLKEYKKIHAKKKYILGFSFGAMIAFLASTKVSASGLILCSLSPYFKEDVSKVSYRRIPSITQQRYKDFSRLHSGTLAKQVKAKEILMLYGSREEKSLIKRVRLAFNKISSKHKYLIPVLETEHDIGDKRYLHKIHQVTKALH